MKEDLWIENEKRTGCSSPLSIRETEIESQWDATESLLKWSLPFLSKRKKKKLKDWSLVKSTEQGWASGLIVKIRNWNPDSIPESHFL